MCAHVPRNGTRATGRANNFMKFAVLDFETTGNGPDDAVIQVGLVIIEEGSIKQSYSSFIHPGRSIPVFITQLTGIAQRHIEDAPTPAQVASELAPLLEGCVLIGHHVEFDLSFLQNMFVAAGLPKFSGRALDTIDFLRIVFPRLPGLQLTSVCSALGIKNERPHRADSDAAATAEIWLQCLQRLDELPLLTIQRIAQLFADDRGDLGWFMREIRNQKEMQTAVDEDAYKYFRQFAVHVRDWQEEEPPRGGSGAENAFPKNTKFTAFYEQLQQKLQQQFEMYEQRKAQEQMIGEVLTSFEQKQHLLVEAGTGTGKSLGYLIPALYYGIKSNQKVVISTHTINLQEQLRQRDIPLLQQIFPVPIRTAILKGRGHYLCLRKFEQKVNGLDFVNMDEDRITAAQMIVWLGETAHGDDEELHFGRKGNEFWRTVESDTDSCLNRACPWFKKCFYHRAKHEANISDVVVTNHSLLFTDVKAENRLLPAYDHLVIDEAHHFEEVAAKHLGIELHYSALLNMLLWLYKDSKNGQLPLLRFRLQRSDAEKSQAFMEKIDKLYPKIISIKEHWDVLTEQFYALFAATGQDANASESGQFVLRVKADALPPQWEAIRLIEDNIYVELGELLKQIDRLLEQLKDDEEEFALKSSVTDLSGIVKNLTIHRDSLRFFVAMPDTNYVYWLEAGSHYKSKSVHLYSVPIDVSPLLQQHFFDLKESVVLTSATLSVDKKFQYVSEQLGLTQSAVEGRLRTAQLDSTFNYREQALVCIPRDFPSVKGVSGDREFTSALVTSLRDVAVATKGRLLVLFTSYRMLKQVYFELKEQLTPHGIQVLGQGVDRGNRSKLIDLFRGNAASVLLGTSSFWEGVDIPGDALSSLAIVRLPFRPPTHPLVEAKNELIKAQQQNPFMKLSVPQAVIRFKQGFGRLVRTASDRGIVVIYDTRVIESFYGKFFLYSLPGPKIEHMKTEQMVPRIEQWLQNAERDVGQNAEG